MKNNPHTSYATGPQGQLIINWKAFSEGYPADAGLIGSDVSDRRDNRDPEEVWNEIIANRETIQGQLSLLDEVSAR